MLGRSLSCKQQSMVGAKQGDLSHAHQGQMEDEEIAKGMSKTHHALQMLSPPGSIPRHTSTLARDGGTPSC